MNVSIPFDQTLNNIAKHITSDSFHDGLGNIIENALYSTCITEDNSHTHTDENSFLYQILGLNYENEIFTIPEDRVSFVKDYYEFKSVKNIDDLGNPGQLSVLEGITGGNLLIDFAFSKTINKFFKITKDLFEFNIYQNHFSQYDPAPKQTLSENKEIGQELPKGVTSGSKTLFIDETGKTIVGYIINKEKELLISTTNDLMECSNISVTSKELETPLQLMGTFFDEIRGYKGNNAFLILLDHNTNKAILYDKQSASKKTNDISRLKSSDINEVYTLIKESSSQRDNVFIQLKNKIKSILTSKKNTSSHAVAKYSGDTGQVLSCFLPLPDDIRDNDKKKLTGIITHDRLLLARALMSGVDIVIWHKEGPFTIFTRKDKKNPEVVINNYISELNNLYYKEKCIEILLKPLIPLIQKKILRIFKIINDEIKSETLLLSSDEPLLLTATNAKIIENMYNKLFYIAHYLNPILKSISLLLKVIPKIEILEEIETLSQDENIENYIVLYKLIINNKKKDIILPKKTTNIFKRLLTKKKEQESKIIEEATIIREKVLSEVTTIPESIEEPTEAKINDYVSKINSKRKLLDLLSIQSLEIIHEFLFELEKLEIDNKEVNKLCKKKITDKPLYFISRGISERNIKKLNYDNCGFKDIIYFIETLNDIETDLEIMPLINELRTLYNNSISNILSKLDVFKVYNSNYHLVNVMKSVYNEYKILVMSGGKIPSLLGETYVTQQIKNIFPTYDDDVNYSEKIIKSVPTILEKQDEKSKKDIVKSAPTILEKSTKKVIQEPEIDTTISLSILGKEYLPNENICINTLIINQLIILQSEIIFINENIQKFLFKNIPILKDIVYNIKLWEKYFNYNGYIFNNNFSDILTNKIGGKRKLYKQRGGVNEYYKDITFELNITNMKLFNDINLEKFMFLVLTLQDISGNNDEIKNYYNNSVLNMILENDELEEIKINKFNKSINTYLENLNKFVLEIKEVDIIENLIYQYNILNTFKEIVEIDYNIFKEALKKSETERTSRDNRIIQQYQEKIYKHTMWLEERTNIFQTNGADGSGIKFLFNDFNGYQDDYDNIIVKNAYHIVLQKFQEIISQSSRHTKKILQKQIYPALETTFVEIEKLISHINNLIEEYYKSDVSEPESIAIKPILTEEAVATLKRKRGGGKKTIKYKKNKNKKNTINKKKYNKKNKTKKYYKKNRNIKKQTKNKKNRK